MATFVLIHGGYGGAWCWELLKPQLEELGHDVVTMDLPIEDMDAGADIYSEVVVANVPSSADRVIVVGHSMGGAVVPLATQRLSATAQVFLCAVVPEIGKSLIEQDVAVSSDTESDELEKVSEEVARNDGGVSTFDPELALTTFFDDCPPDLASRSVARLRPQAIKPITEKTPLREWPKVPTYSIVCREDRSLPITWSRQLATDRLGVAPIERRCPASC